MQFFFRNGLLCLCLVVCINSLFSQELRSVYVLNEKNLVPEGIDYSSVQDAFYVTSVGLSKIVRIDGKTGEQTDFISEHAFGYMPGVGLYIDDPNDRLYAIGGYYLLDSVSSLFAFDLNTGELLQRYDMPEPGKHFLNDLIMDRSGNIYMTNTKDSSIYVLKKSSHTLEPFFKSGNIKYPNGIAISDDNTKLYIASFTNGVRTLDIETKQLLNDIDSVDHSTGIDGLEFYNGHLYAIQNGVTKNSDNFRKLILNETQNAIVRTEQIVGYTRDLNAPLTFTIVNDKAVLIANSNIQYLDQTNYEFPESDTIPISKLRVYNLSRD